MRSSPPSRLDQIRTDACLTLPDDVPMELTSATTAAALERRRTLGKSLAPRATSNLTGRRAAACEPEDDRTGTVHSIEWSARMHPKRQFDRGTQSAGKGESTSERLPPWDRACLTSRENATLALVPPYHVGDVRARGSLDPGPDDERARGRETRRCQNHSARACRLQHLGEHPRQGSTSTEGQRSTRLGEDLGDSPSSVGYLLTAPGRFPLSVASRAMGDERRQRHEPKSVKSSKKPDGPLQAN